MLLSVVIPVFRNEETLAQLHHRIIRTLEGAAIALEIIFVDDASDDHSADRIRDLMRSDRNVRLVSLAKNVGQQQAVLAGLRAAQGDVIATLDADLQDPPEALARLLSHLGDPADAVFATRRGAYEARGRLRTSRIFKRLLNRVSGVPADAGMFLLMNRDAMRKILEDTPRSFYLPTAVLAVTRRVACVPVERAPRAAGMSQYTSLSRTRLGCTILYGALRGRWRSRFNLER